MSDAWVAVAERLPAEGRVVLVRYDSGLVTERKANRGGWMHPADTALGTNAYLRTPDWWLDATLPWRAP